MKKISVVLVLLIGLLGFVTCTTEKTPIDAGNTSPDQLLSHQVELAPGVFLKLKGMEENEYTLDDVLQGTLVVVNKSSQPFHIHVNGWPPYMGFTVKELQKTLIYNYPMGTGRSIHDEDLQPGDSLSEAVEWGEWQHFEGTRKLKVYSGKYTLEFFLRGQEGSIKKEITVLPEGNRWDAQLYVWEIGDDSTRLRFFIRNRIPQEATLHPLPQNALEIQWFSEHPDTLYGGRYLDFPADPISFAGHSDWTYEFQLNRSEPHQYNVGSTIKLRVILHTEEGDFAGEYYFM